MKSRTLQAALLGIALFFVSWLVLSSNSHAPSKLLSTSRSFSAQPVTDVSATELFHGKAGTPEGAGSSFLTDEQVEVLRKAGLLTPAQLDQLEKAAKHWKEMPDHMNYETVDEAARHRSDPIPNGRPPMPEVAPGLTLDPHKSFVDPHYDSSPVPVDTGAEVQDPRLLHDIMESINDLGHTRFWRMDCPGQFEMGNRYQELNLTGTKGVDRNKIKYFFALDLTQIARILPPPDGHDCAGHQISWSGALCSINCRRTIHRWYLLDTLRTGHTVQEFGASNIISSKAMSIHTDLIKTALEVSRYCETWPCTLSSASGRSIRTRQSLCLLTMSRYVRTTFSSFSFNTCTRMRA